MLGIEWLKQFGPVTTDYTSFIMRFNHLGQEVSLRADVATGPEPASTAQVKRMIHTGSTSALFHLCILSANPAEEATYIYGLDSQETLASYLSIFSHLKFPFQAYSYPPY